ncbi:hypothetical protein B0H16DRAFT_1525509 [Mycena metata]|uniref:Uncharacterized protein n=1 Tax=Mycena metata TaxID=1033252 RepID=A0AAD7NKH2_9AGAR|nr:hypothetical protein B0H16DRAFT_1525509 [Mycena metata]
MGDNKDRKLATGMGPCGWFFDGYHHTLGELGDGPDFRSVFIDRSNNCIRVGLLVVQDESIRKVFLAGTAIPDFVGGDAKKYYIFIVIGLFPDTLVYPKRPRGPLVPVLCPAFWILIPKYFSPCTVKLLPNFLRDFRQQVRPEGGVPRIVKFGEYVAVCLLVGHIVCGRVDFGGWGREGKACESDSFSYVKARPGPSAHVPRVRQRCVQTRGTAQNARDLASNAPFMGLWFEKIPSQSRLMEFLLLSSSSLYFTQYKVQSK